MFSPLLLSTSVLRVGNWASVMSSVSDIQDRRWRRLRMTAARNTTPAAIATLRIEPSAPVLRRGPPSGPEWLHEVKFDGWRAQLHKAGRDMDTPVNMVGALFKCCLSQFWKMIVAKRAMLLPWSALIFAVERSGRRRGINRAGAGQSALRASRLR